MQKITPDLTSDTNIVWEDDYDAALGGEIDETEAIQEEQGHDTLETVPVKPFPACIIMNKNMIGGSLNMIPTEVNTRVIFRYSENFRSSMEIVLRSSRDMKYDFNPGAQAETTTVLEVPAKSIADFTYRNLPDETKIADLPEEFQGCGGLENRQYALISFKCSNILITNGVAPKLATSAMQKKFEDTISDARLASAETPAEFHMLVRRTLDTLDSTLQNMSYAVSNEQTNDPILKLFINTPYAKKLNVGNLIPWYDFPEVPIQRARMVHADDLEQSATQIYGATSEHQYQKLIAEEISDAEFVVHALPALGSVDSVSKLYTAYLLYVDWRNHSEEKPKVGDVYKVTLGLLAPTPTLLIVHRDVPVASQIPLPTSPSLHPTSAELPPVDTVMNDDLQLPPPTLVISSTAENGSLTSVQLTPQQLALRVEQNREREQARRALRSKTRPVAAVKEQSGSEMIISGPRDEDEDGYYTEPEPEILMLPSFGDFDPNEWHGYVLDTPHCPQGFVPIVVERAKEPGYNGPLSTRPYVQTKVPVMNVPEFIGLSSLYKAIEKNTTTFNIVLSPNFSDQPYKDSIRSADAYFSKESLRGLRDYHSGRVDPLTPAHTTNLHQLFGENAYLESLTLTKSQQNALTYVEACPFGTAIIHGPFATGKSFFALWLAARVLASDLERKFMYVSTNNLAVDDGATRLYNVCRDAGIGANIIRLLPLQSEQREFIKVSIPGDRPDTHLQQSDDTIVNQFTASYLLHSISKSHAARQNIGDVRRRLTNLSLAQAMIEFLEEHYRDDTILSVLKSDLVTVVQDKMSTAEADPDMRNRIATGTKYLCKTTLSNADAVFCTLNCASKVTVYENFQPHFIVLDEAGRAKEIETFALYAFYKPHAYLVIGDHYQTGPAVFSVDRERDAIPWVNIYGRQQLLSAMQRWITIGIPSIMLLEQSRCHLDNAQWVNDEIYHGQLIDNCSWNPQQVWFREWAFKMGTGLPAFVEIDGIKHAHPGTNVLLIDVPNSYGQTEEAGHSMYNLDHFEIVMGEITRMRQNPTFPVGTKILVVSLYNAQRAKYRAIFERDGLQNIDVRSVEGAQGNEADVVFVDFARSQGPGFQGDKRRLCVAGSRAKFLCVYIMDMERITNVRHPKRNPRTRHLYSLIDYMKRLSNVTTVIAPSSLCKHCGSTDHKSSACNISDEDRVCRSCHTKGHISSNCPTKGDRQTCYNCGDSGHLQSECPKPKAPRLGTNQKTCPNCRQPGHTIGNCTEPCRADFQCNKCGGRGHFSQHCKTKMSRAHVNDIHHHRRQQLRQTRTAQDSTQNTSNDEANTVATADTEMGNTNDQSAANSGNNGWSASNDESDNNIVVSQSAWDSNAGTSSGW